MKPNKNKSNKNLKNNKIRMRGRYQNGGSKLIIAKPPRSLFYLKNPTGVLLKGDFFAIQKLRLEKIPIENFSLYHITDLQSHRGTPSSRNFDQNVCPVRGYILRKQAHLYRNNSLYGKILKVPPKDRRQGLRIFLKTSVLGGGL